MQSPEFLGVFVIPLEKSGIQYFVTGSVATIFYGEPRLTHDIDLVVYISVGDISKIRAIFSDEAYYCPPEEVIEIESRRIPYGHVNVIHHKTGMKADLYLESESQDNNLQAWAFQHRKRVDLGNELSIWLAPPEYLIVRKLEFFREGGSQKHLEDLRTVSYTHLTLPTSG